MSVPFTTQRRSRLAILTVVFALCLGLIAASFPQPALAATCVSTYFVRAGDTTPKIAKTFGLKWSQIAIANDLKQPYRLDVGQSLCIPPQDSPTERSQAGTTTVTKQTKLTVLLTNDLLEVTLGGLSRKGVYTVKVRDSDASVGGWYKLANLKIDRKETVTAVYRLPQELSDIAWISVCLKNGTTDELICQTVVNFR
jgi:LysM repeat protein